MGKRAVRSLKASTIGISRANQSLLNFESKIALADELEISRATVQKFFVGKPIGRENFYKICQKLQLPWKAIADIPNDEFSVEESVVASQEDIDALIEDIRQKVRSYIELKCGIVRVLNMAQPIQLNEIFTEVNILEKIGRNRRIDIKDLLKVCLVERSKYSYLFPKVHSQVSGIAAIEKYPKLMILGQPGSGKTTFLKYIAVQCIQGRLFFNFVPLFISLKVFAEIERKPSLLEWIYDVFNNCGIVEPNIVKNLLAQGRMLILLDGLDEVKEIDSPRVFSAINSFYNQFYRNRFIVTCRTAAKDFAIEEFVEVELANFDDKNIADFASKWFVKKDLAKVPKFLQTLRQDTSIRELANNPLLLTLLCLIFEEDRLPTSRLEIYREGIDLLLRKWDAKRNIERQQIYQNLSVLRKQELLSHIAFTSFVKGDYFLKQQELEQYIANYLELVLHEKNIDLYDLTAILQSIEAQHGLLVERVRGIYSFSHLVFQEYFTARKIAYSSPETLNSTLEQLSDRLILNKRWREVTLLTAEMLKNGDRLLLMMHQRINDLLLEYPKIQEFLYWVNRKAAAIANKKSATIRAFYYDLELAHILSIFGSTFELSRTLEINFNRTLEPSLALDLALNRALLLPESMHRASEPERTIERVLERAIFRARNSEPDLAKELQKMKQQLSNLTCNKQEFQRWWQVNGKNWTEQLIQRVRLKRDIGHNWQFTHQQKQILKQYYDANLLLVECLNASFFVSKEVREKIENALLLPLSEASE